MELTSFKLYSLNCTVAYCVCTDPTLLATLQLQSGLATDVSKHLLRVCSKAIPIQSYVAPAPNHMHVYAGPGRRLISVDLDKALIEWYKEQIAQQRHVFNRHIKTKAIPIQSYVAPAPNHIHVYAGILPAWRMRICEPYAGKG